MVQLGFMGKNPDSPGKFLEILENYLSQIFEKIVTECLKNKNIFLLKNA